MRAMLCLRPRGHSGQCLSDLCLLNPNCLHPSHPSPTLLQVLDCVNNPVCKAGLDCLQGCSFNDQVCQYRCIVRSVGETLSP